MAKKQTYSTEVKLQAVELYLSGELGGYRLVADQFNVHATQVMRAYKEEGIDALKKKRVSYQGII
ncbi:helix-turn-helix domain-containing protein [Domibacillus aminovorans]|uniref:Transposase n=1 Tax=Domibacillus aminovorans TaxID=29332 RepID=A0A177L2Q3_9BACI|nr:helix-turn-helix domain-containing protein [Domibacillus aminovorans]OAH59726.1 hypothetical protein AWH49_18330 [Domibacillus aminovorans]